MWVTGRATGYDVAMALVYPWTGAQDMYFICTGLRQDIQKLKQHYEAMSVEDFNGNIEDIDGRTDANACWTLVAAVAQPVPPRNVYKKWCS